MLALLVALAVLALAFRKLVSRRASAASHAVAQPPSVRDKLRRQAFEHVDHPSAARRVLLLYATEYGFAQQVASHVARHLAQHHLAPRVVNALHYPLVNFAKESAVLFICSTTGDGVPPTEAADFRDALQSHQLSLPPALNVAILALGDRAYPHFCRAGAIFEHLFNPASTLHPLTNINQQHWPSIQAWLRHITPKLNRLPPSPLADYLPAAIDKYANSYQSPTRYSRNNPYMATVTARTPLTTALPRNAQQKHVIRVEFAIQPHHLHYTVGDAVAVIPTNNPDHVTNLLLAMAVNGHEQVTIPHVPNPLSFEHALTNHLDICTIQPSLIYHLANGSSNASQLSLAHKILRSPLSATAELTPFGETYVQQRHVFDLLSDFVSVSLTPQTLVQYLRPLHARYYSVSSTPLTNPSTIAITVDVLRYTSLNVERHGVASSFLNNRCLINHTKVPIFISSNPNFRLPKDLSKPIIMIGPGTGIAPFIAFIQQRVAQNASGTNCLFFGCRHEAQDFLYQSQLRQYEAQRQLKLFTAFSRDGASKVYVQHRMAQNAHMLWEMMQAGAHVYVCGDGRRMAADVHDALRKIVQRCAQFTFDQSEAYLQMLTDQQRYQRDVWVS